MSIRRRFATWTSAMAMALVGVLLIASPARAEGEVEVEVNGLADSIRAGDRFEDFRAVFTNTSGEAISGVFAVITVSLPGAPPDAIYMQRDGGGGLSGEVAGEGTVAFTDPAPFDLGRGGGNARRRVDFLIAFGEAAPDGEAAITVAAYTDDGERLGSADASIQVRGGTGRTTPPNTDPGIVPTFEAGPSYSIAPLTDVAVAPAGGSTAPKIMYVLGSLLVVIGLMTLVLILRPPGLRHAGAAAQPGPRRPMRWPGRIRPAAPAYPRSSSLGRAGTEGAQQWPVVATPPPAVAAPPPAVATPPPGMAAPPPAYRPGPPRRDPGPRTGTGRVGGDRGPHTGPTRPVRSPAPDDGRWRYE